MQRNIYFNTLAPRINDANNRKLFTLRSYLFGRSNSLVGCSLFGPLASSLFSYYCSFPNALGYSNLRDFSTKRDVKPSIFKDYSYSKSSTLYKIYENVYLNDMFITLVKF